MHTRRILRSFTCFIVLFLLLTGCKNTEVLSGKPGTQPPAAVDPLQEPADSSAGAGNSSAGTGLDDTEAVEPESGQELASPAEIDGSAGQLYGLAFEAMMPIDKGLNAGMEYIAIDFSVLSHLTEEDKQFIEQYMGKFSVPVKEATLEQLMESEEDSFHENGMALKGVLLQIEKVEINEDSAIIEGMKYKSGKGAIGINIKLSLENGAWKVVETADTWIS
ncbi:hypothetical protein [Paenibacillus ihumii]|uniref:hypothetical protein n=1 Tax=Paenibacillus ihumii TaxID=687436 RepID=UPI0006D84DB7|nr:hypothetical protein [Paenibacillus ihumii]